MASTSDRKILRDLAKQVAEIAALPVMEKRRQMWMRHNQMQAERPLILVFPEGAWRELLPESECKCTNMSARAKEFDLRARIYAQDNLHDDSVTEALWNVPKVIHNTGWGLEPQHDASPLATGAWAFHPVINQLDDLNKLVFPKINVEEVQTARNLEEAKELFDDILDVRSVGVTHISFHLMSLYCQLRGLDQVMWDMYDRPEMLYRAMTFLEEGNRRLVQQYIDLDLLSLNNNNTYHSSGGVGFTSELPAPDYLGRVRPCDMWASAEAQEMAQVSPAMHAEFILPYEKRLLEPFGLTGYGCCEDLSSKLPDVLTIPHIRRISISPFADVVRCAEQLQQRAIFSWKPHPAHLVGEFDADFIRAYIKRTVDTARTNGCVLEMILKDTHTCESHPERFTLWSDIAQQIAANS
jgi:hypothetical protein